MKTSAWEKTLALQRTFEANKPRRHLCEILIKSKASLEIPGLLKEETRKEDTDLLRLLVKSGVSLEEQGQEALFQAADRSDIRSAAFLISSGVDINTPGQDITSLTEAAFEQSNMVGFLIAERADINAPACPNGGRTALQRALRGQYPMEIATLLMDKGADFCAPHALVNGVTAPETVCNHSYTSESQIAALCNRLLDAGAQVNRDNNEPSSALHGVISNRLDEALCRFLEPQRGVILDYMWCNQ
jgi:hypothetical protein